MKRKKEPSEKLAIPQMPFDDALRKILRASHHPVIRKMAEKVLSHLKVIDHRFVDAVMVD